MPVSKGVDTIKPLDGVFFLCRYVVMVRVRIFSHRVRILDGCLGEELRVEVRTVEHVLMWIGPQIRVPITFIAGHIEVAGDDDPESSTL